MTSCISNYRLCHYLLCQQLCTLLLLLLLLSSSSTTSLSSSSSNFSLLSFDWEIFTYPGIINRIMLGGLICSLKSFLQLNMCQELQIFCNCIYIYIFGCRLSLVRLRDSDFGITTVHEITIGNTSAAFCFHTAHISFAIIIIIKYHYRLHVPAHGRTKYKRKHVQNTSVSLHSRILLA